ncbi:MAG: DUF624 domain-containing protein [Ruminococcus sp.]|nr:DUF624 domain-containing protein [Ruminococcus sp.]
MALFGNNYERASSGIAKNTPKKKGFFRYWEIFWRKFWKLIELNLEYSCFFLPLLAAVVVFFIESISTNVAVVLMIAFAILFAILIGPATAAFTKILKNFYMEKPTFVVHDFFQTLKSEFKHALPIGIIDCILVCSIVSAFYVYPELIDQLGSKIYYVFFAITLSVGLIALLMNFYIFPMMISTTLSMKNVLKNSLALAIVALKKNVVTLLILAAVVAVYGVILFFVPLQFAMILFFLLPFFPAAWLGLMVVLQCYPIIQKYIINPYYEQKGEMNPELNIPETDEEETVFEDMGGKEKPIEPKKKAGGKSSKSGGSDAAKGHKGKIIS